MASDAFVSLDAEAKRLAALLATVRYSILICDDGFRVAGYEPAPDYGADIEETFAKFAQGTVKDYAVTFAENPEMNSIEEKVLEFVARLEPDIFCGLHAFATDNATFVDSVVATFDREVQFYFASLAYISKFERAGLPMCYPEVTDTDKAISSRDGFDLALADKLIDEHSRVVCNDFFLEQRERVLVVSGPNQGGKTTFARAFGQMHYLASLGCQVSGRQARLFLFDRIFTHFERPEDVTTLRGKLEDDLIRMRDILDQATPKSIVIMNEIFTSTTLSDAIWLGMQILERVIATDMLCVCVTFLDELASLGEQTVSIVAGVVTGDGSSRTFEMTRRPADGLCYAVSIAKKYRLTYECLIERIPT